VRAALWTAASLALLAVVVGCDHKTGEKSNAQPEPLTLTSFRDKAAAAVTTQSDLEGKPGFGAKVDVTSPTSLNTFSVGVEKSFAEYKRNPQALDEVLKRFVADVEARMAAGNKGESFAGARAHILPILKPKASFRHVADEPVTTPFPGDLRVAYAVQGPGSFTLVSSADLRRWKQSPKQIDALARANLLDETNKEQKLKCEEKLCGWASGDGYDAARFIVPELRAQIVRKIGPAVYAVPRESVYVALPIKLADRIKDKVVRDFVTAPNPVSRDLFVERDGEVVVLGQ
jgi:uncharacterized protein YtpQ (UPF0354 family)